RLARSEVRARDQIFDASEHETGVRSFGYVARVGDALLALVDGQDGAHHAAPLVADVELEREHEAARGKSVCVPAEVLLVEGERRMPVDLVHAVVLRLRDATVGPERSQSGYRRYADAQSVAVESERDRRGLFRLSVAPHVRGLKAIAVSRAPARRGDALRQRRV